jgi:hypothetical protein
MLLRRGVSPASEQAELLPHRGKRERTSFRPHIPGGRHLHSTRGRSYGDSGEQAGDEILLKRAGSWNLRLANAAAEYASLC